MKKVVLILAAIAMLGLSANSQNVGQATNPCPEQPRIQPITHYASPAKNCERGCEQTVIINPESCYQNSNCYPTMQKESGFRTWDMISCGLILCIIGFLLGLLASKKDNNNHHEWHGHGNDEGREINIIISGKDVLVDGKKPGHGGHGSGHH